MPSEILALLKTTITDSGEVILASLDERILVVVEPLLSSSPLPGVSHVAGFRILYTIPSMEGQLCYIGENSLTPNHRDYIPRVFDDSIHALLFAYELLKEFISLQAEYDAQTSTHIHATPTTLITKEVKPQWN